MNILRSLIFCGVIFGMTATAEQPRQHPYTAQNSGDVETIALYQFDEGTELKDISGNGHDLRLRGKTQIVADGKFGGSLESFAVSKEDNKAIGAEALDHDALSPKGAFTIELWFKAKSNITEHQTSFLIDKKYYYYNSDSPNANNDYCLYLRRGQRGTWRLVAMLGFGSDSVDYVSQDITITPGEWNHIAFTYDGAGTGRIFWNMNNIGRTHHDARGDISPGIYHLTIGDRRGSTYQGCPGYIDDVRISDGIPGGYKGTFAITTEKQRTVFVRMERNAALELAVINDSGSMIRDCNITFGFPGEQKNLPLGDLASAAKICLPVAVNTELKPGMYPMTVTVRGRNEDRTVEKSFTLEITIVPRPLPNIMPVVMWGSGDLPRLKEVGFTHDIVSLINDGKIWKAGKPTDLPLSLPDVQKKREMLDNYLKEGMGAVARLYPGRWVVRDEVLKQKYQRVNRDGDLYESENVCASAPEVLQFGYNVGASAALAYGDMPALSSCLIHSEIRDHTSICFHDHDRKAFRDFSGYNIPEQCVSKDGRHYSAFQGFPANHIIPDDDRVLTFYKWFWKNGDGWNPLHTQVHKGLKSKGQDDIWTFFDPATRVPSIWGSGGEVDYISQWTYSYPDPIKIGQATDELFAMADGSHTQGVMKMTQIIWYRSRTAPDLPADESKRVQWERDLPEARFITISPDHMREAFWSKISRPIRGIMYHGWGSLVEGSHRYYECTHHGAKLVLAELIRKIVRPLGPTLLQIPDRKSDVALLESFSSQIFAGRGSRGWSKGWEADMHLILQWAQLQPQIIYDETILRDGLDDFSVLVMPNCDVLTTEVAKAIKLFQKRGGILIADENVAPAIVPDLFVQSYRRIGKPDKDKAVLQAKAAQLRQELDPFYLRHGESDNPDIITRFRQFGSTDYLFVLNDHRTFGNYVGQHGLVMENGLPASATLTVQRQRGFVYDLTEQKALPTTTSGSYLKFQADFGPAQGRLYMITERPIKEIVLSGPQQCHAGASVTFEIDIVSNGRQPINAVIPVDVRIIDPDGHEAEPSGYYGAADGSITIDFDSATNDTQGIWTFEVTELASGLSKTLSFKLVL